MKIAYFKVTNHPIFGNLNISFSDATGEPYDTIIFAGENGAGKSNLLNLLFSCTATRADNQIKPPEKREYAFVLNEKEEAAIIENANLNPYFKNGFSRR